MGQRTQHGYMFYINALGQAWADDHWVFGVKANIECDYREHLSMLAIRNFPLPHIDSERAGEVAMQALELMGIPLVQAGKPLDNDQLSALAAAYDKGSGSWPQIVQGTSASFGDLLVALATNNLPLPKVTSEKSPQQDALFNKALGLALESRKTNQCSP